MLTDCLPARPVALTLTSFCFSLIGGSTNGLEIIGVATGVVPTGTFV
jgi:hypothetical protein